jgi:hypothetical protein
MNNGIEKIFYYPLVTVLGLSSCIIFYRFQNDDSSISKRSLVKRGPGNMKAASVERWEVLQFLWRDGCHRGTCNISGGENRINFIQSRLRRCTVKVEEESRSSADGGAVR